MFLSVYNSVENVLQLIGIILVFLIILAAAYAASVLVGKAGNNTYGVNRNMKAIETLRLGNGQFLQIVEVGDRYFLLSVTKEHIELITELEKDKLSLIDAAEFSVPFHDILDKVKIRLDKKQKDDK